MTAQAAPSIRIDSDDAEATRHLHRLAVLVRQHGGRFSDGVHVRAQHGEMTLTSDRPPARQARLLTVPYAVMPDTRQFQIRLHGDGFTAQPAQGARSGHGAQQQVLETMVALYNATGKPRQWARLSPWLTLWRDPDLLHQLIDQPVNGRGGPPHLAAYRAGDWETTLVESFLKARTFGLKPEKDLTRSDTADVLMPFLDCLNHHFRARGFQHTQGEAGGAIYSYMDRPVAGSGECFARYRLLDCHSAFVGYGFLDSSAPFVMSQAGNVVLADGLQLDVRRNAARGFGGTLPKGSRDLALFMPHVVNKGTDRLELSRLLIPGANAPRALRRVLGLLISRKRPEWTPSRVEGAVLDAEDQILAMSNSFFDAVATKVSEARRCSEADDPPGRNATLCTVDELVRCQKHHLDAYKDRVEAA